MICCPTLAVYPPGVSLHIRTFQEADQASVIALWQSCGLVVPHNNPQRDIQRKLAMGRDLFLVGEHEDGIIATVMGGYEGHRGWVNYLAVAPANRGQGLGRTMMNKLEQRLLARACPKLNLMVRDSNHEAIAFYQALGYQVDAVTSLGKRLIPD
jgi:ribosomal protein S18 acetylase RimI-like enzyme